MDLSLPPWGFPDPSASPSLFYACGWGLLAVGFGLTLTAGFCGVVIVRDTLRRRRAHKAWMAWVERQLSVDEGAELDENDWSEQQAEDTMPTLAESGDVNIYHKQILPTQEKRFPELIRRLREIADELAADGREITSEDIWRVFGPIPLGVDPRIMGAVFDAKKWLKKGFKQSERRERHGAPIRIWQLRNPPRAA